MQKLKKFPLVGSTSKLFSENKKSYVQLLVPNNLQRTLAFQAERNNDTKGLMKHESEGEILNKSNEKNSNELILYKPMVRFEIPAVLTKFYETFGFETIDRCTGCNRFLAKNEEDIKCTALVPWFYNSRALIPYSKLSSIYINPMMNLNQTLNLTLQYKSANSELPNQYEEKATIVYSNPSKFALSLSEIWKEMKEAKDVPSRTDVAIGISRNCRSCPAVVSIKGFTSKLSSTRTESKVLLLSCDNFAKFERTFTRLLAKNKLRNVKPLLGNLENRDQILTKLERALINHNLRINKNNDMIKRNVIMMPSKMMENLREQLDSNEDIEEINAGENTSTCNFTNTSSKASNEHMGRTNKTSNIMIVNDGIFKRITPETSKKSSCHISKEENNIIYLNNAIFKELRKEKVNKILTRKYTKYSDEEKEIFVRIPTRQISKKLKPLRSVDDKCEEHQEIPLENLIAAVTQKKRLEYIERSKVSWKVFKQFEETMEKVKILNFPPPEDIPKENHEQTIENKIEDCELPKLNSPYSRKRKRSVQDKERKKFVEKHRSESPQAKENTQLKINPKRDKTKEKRTNLSQIIPAREKDVEIFEKHIDRMKRSEFIEKEKTRGLEEGRTDSTNKKGNLGPKTKANKEKVYSENTLKTKRPDKIYQPATKTDESNKDVAQLKMKDNKETKSKLKTNSDVKTLRQKGGIQTSTMGKIMKKAHENTIFKKNMNSERNEHVSPTSKIEHKKGKILNISTTKNETTTKDSPRKMTKKTLIKESNSKKEEFINLKGNRNLLFDEQKHWSFKEKEESSIIVLHEKPMQSFLSSSQSEVIESLVDDPKMKVRKELKSRNDPSKKSSMNSESQMVVEELLGSKDPAKIEKVKKPTDRKIRSKLPILGTPTSIIKHIEKVVATALTTGKIRENFNEEEVDENINKVIQEKSRTRRKLKQEKLKSIESDEKPNNEENKNEENSENKYNSNEKSKINNVKKVAKIEEIGEENIKLQIDEILAMNAINDELIQKQTGKKNLKNRKENESLKKVITVEQGDELYEKKILKDNIVEEDTGIKSKQEETRLMTPKPAELIVAASQNSINDEVIQNQTEKKNLKNRKENGSFKKVITVEQGDELYEKKILKDNIEEEDTVIKSKQDETRLMTPKPAEIIVAASQNSINDEVIQKQTEKKNLKNRKENGSFKKVITVEQGDELYEKKILKDNIEEEDTGIKSKQDETSLMTPKPTEMIVAVSQHSNDLQNEKIEGGTSGEYFLPRENIKNQEKIQMNTTEKDSCKKRIEEMNYKRQFKKNEGTEEKENTGCSAEMGMERSTKNKEAYKEKLGTKTMMICDTKTKNTERTDSTEVYENDNEFTMDKNTITSANDSFDNIDNRSTAALNENKTKILLPKKNMENDETNQMKKNCSKRQFTIYKGIEQEENMEYNVESEKEKGTCERKTGENTMHLLHTEAEGPKIDDIISNIENKNETVINENEDFSHIENNRSIESEQSKSPKFSNDTNNRIDESIKIQNEKMNRNNFDNFIETYFDEKEMENVGIFKDSKHKESEISEGDIKQLAEPDIAKIKQNEMKEKSTPSTVDPEMIRIKRLIYFGDKMKCNTKVKETQFEQKSALKPNTTQHKNKLKIEKKTHSLKSENLIENSSQTSAIERNLQNSRIHSDQITGSKSNIEDKKGIEKQNSFSQYDTQPNVGHSEKAIETETDRKDAAVIVKNENLLNGTKKTVEHKTLKQSVSDNVIIIKAARTNSEETVENFQDMSKSSLKKVQDKINLMQNSNLTNNAMQKCREIAVELKKSQEKFVRTVPSSFYKIYYEARKLKNKLSKTKIMTKRSKEIINKFTNTFPRSIIDSANQAELKEANKPESQVKSVIERKVTSKIKLLTKPPIRIRTKKRNMRYVKSKSKEGEKIKSDLSPSLSVTELQNRSIGSLFADTVASALARCGDVEQIMRKYNDSSEKISIEPKPSSVEKSRDLMQEYRADQVQKEDEFLMNDGVRRLVLNATVEINEDTSLGDEWKCYPKAVLVKKPKSEGQNQIPLNPSNASIKTNQALNFTTLDTGIQDKSNVFFPILDDTGECKVFSSKNLQKQQSNITNPNHNDEADALEETKQDLTKLKILLQEEKERTIEDIYCADEEIVLIKNNETFKLRICHQENDTPKSISDLDKVLVSERNDRTAEGSTSPPPHVKVKVCSFQEKISNETNSTDNYNGSSQTIRRKQIHIFEREREKEKRNSLGSNSKIDLKNIDEIPKCLRLSGTDLREENSPEIFATPLASNTNFADSYDSLEQKHISNLKVSELLPLLKEGDCLKICRETIKDKSDLLEATITSKKFIETHPKDVRGKLMRKDEIELSCKLSNYPNSLVCREKRRDIVKTVLDNCESIQQKVESVLNRGHKEDNCNEIFINLERRDHFLSKSVSSKDNVSNDESTGSKIRTLKNYTRTFATDNHNEDYSRLKGWKLEETKVDKEVKYDLEALDEIHDEALDDEMFFGREIKRRKKELNEDMRDKPRRSVYHEIVRRSELNELKPVTSGEVVYSPTEGEENLSEKSKETKLESDIESKDGNKAGAPFRSLSTPQHLDEEEPYLPNNEKKTIRQVNDDTTEEIVPTGHNTEAYQDEMNSKYNNEENVEVVYETEGESKELCDNSEENENTSRTRKEEPEIECGIGPNEELTLRNIQNGKKHKILEKFALISQEPDSSIFKINNDVKFDRSNKRMCQPEKPKMRPNQEKEEDRENPTMIVNLSPSQELNQAAIPKMSDTELKNLLLQHPKALMKIASDIMSKNQYLSFLLDLKSTRELKEYWMNKIRKGIVSSRSFGNLTNVVENCKPRSIQDDVVAQKRIHHLEKEIKLIKDSIEHDTDTPIGFEHASKSTKNESSDFPSTKSDIKLGEKKTTLEVETGKTRAKIRQPSPSALRNKMLKRDDRQGKSNKRNLSFQHQDLPEQAPLPYTLEKYLKSPLQINHEDLREYDGSSKSLRIRKNLHGREIEMEITHEDININRQVGLEKNEAVLEDRILPVKRRVGKFLLKLKAGKAPPLSYKKETCDKFNMEKRNSNRKNNQNASSEARNDENICLEIVESNITKGVEDSEKKSQQTAIVLPGREPFKISLISDEVSGSQVALIKDHPKKNALENLSDVLSNCSGPVSSSCSKEGKTVLKKRLLKKPGFKKTNKSGIKQSNTPSSTTSSICTNSLQNSPQKAPAAYNPNGLKLKKFENPLKEFVRNQDDFQPSNVTDQLSNKGEVDVSRMRLNEEKKIQDIIPKSLSEVLKEDPDFLKKIREKKMLNTSKEEEAAKRFEYRFHDFRRKEDKNLEMKTKREEEQKKDLLTKFKCLIEARKVATERNRLNIRSNENQQIQPKVFSKILEKISYFKELEEHPNTERNGVNASGKSAIFNKRGVDSRSPRVTNGNRRMMHTRKKQINEDELMTWVQEHPAVPEKKMAMANEGNCEGGKQNVIHIPWTPSFPQVDAQA